MPIQSFEGKIPKIHASVFVAPTASIIGDVIIRTGSSVWPGAVIRGDVNRISIGKYSSIQDNTVIHATPSNLTAIGDYVTIGHGAIIHATIVEDNCLVGMNAVILVGAKIGKNSTIGAGSVIVENTSVPPNSLVVGIPAKIVRTVRARDEVNELVDRARHNAEIYSNLAQRYKQDYT